jgi:hypothetical protein
MTAKCCQLCGKPLSRLRVGGDGDFCSREHRHQHRLRRGMDRLEEANKVTSLMRRRENPRHISSARLMCNSALDRRGFFDSKQLVLRTGASFAPVMPGPAAPRVTGDADRYLIPQVSQRSGPGLSRWADTSGERIDGRRTLPLLPARRRNLPAQIMPAPLVALRCESPARLAPKRDFGMLRQRAIRVHLGGPALTSAALRPRSTLALERQTQLRKIASSALEGNALRVSIGIGFRVGTARWRAFHGQPLAPTALVWPRAFHRVLPELRDASATYRDLGIAISKSGVRLPEVGSGNHRAHFVFPGAVTEHRWQPATAALPPKRTTDLCWKPAEPRSRRMAVQPPAAGFATRNGTHLFRIVLAPSSTLPAQQVASTTFRVREPLGCPVVAFEGTVATAIAGPASAAGNVTEMPAPQTVAAEPAVAIRIEEHFGEGWGNWMGGTSEWKVDVAGVRTGPLALFVPTLNLIDYELDFLSRIDTRSLTWVVRAAGLDEYLRCTLTAIPGGELEFSRCAVVAGAPQSPVTAPRRLPGKPRSTMTVSTRVSGQNFTVRVDGKTIDTWNDDHFPMGGIGFIGAADDRARLYWVKLSSTESNGKEYQEK